MFMVGVCGYDLLIVYLVVRLVNSVGCVVYVCVYFIIWYYVWFSYCLFTCCLCVVLSLFVVFGLRLGCLLTIVLCC